METIDFIYDKCHSSKEFIVFFNKIKNFQWNLFNDFNFEIILGNMDKFFF